MTTAALDIDLLNELFDNQKKLDDLFSFDDDSFLANSISYSANALGIGGQKDSQNSVDSYSNEEFSFNSEDTVFVSKSRSITTFVLPLVVEIAVISYYLMYFI